MFALAIDGQYKGLREGEQIQRILKVRDSDAKIEVARFVKGQGWKPVCLKDFELPRAA